MLQISTSVKFFFFTTAFSQNRGYYSCFLSRKKSVVLLSRYRLVCRNRTVNRGAREKKIYHSIEITIRCDREVYYIIFFVSADQKKKRVKSRKNRIYLSVLVSPGHGLLLLLHFRRDRRRHDGDSNDILLSLRTKKYFEQLLLARRERCRTPREAAALTGRVRADGRCWNASCRAPGGALYRRATRGNSGQRDVPTHAAAAAADTDDDAAGQLPPLLPVRRHFSTVLYYYYYYYYGRVCVRARSRARTHAHTYTRARVHEIRTYRRARATDTATSCLASSSCRRPHDRRRRRSFLSERGDLPRP